MSDEQTPAGRLEKALREHEASKRTAADVAAKSAPEVARMSALQAELAALPQSDRRRVLDAAGLAHVSAAPRPLEPLRGSGGSTPRQRAEPVRWPAWLALPYVELWQAVALSMSIAPAEHLKPELRRGASRYSLLPADFFARLNWCQRAVSTNGPIKPQGPLYQGMLQDPHCGVLLAEVAAFLTQAEYEVPAEMRAWPERGPVALEVGDAPGAQRYKRRADQLSAVLSLAKKRAVAPDDWMSVWASLVKLAQAPDRPAPLLGYSEGEGVKYQTDSDAEPVGWLRREAVRKRLTR